MSDEIDRNKMPTGAKMAIGGVVGIVVLSGLTFGGIAIYRSTAGVSTETQRETYDQEIGSLDLLGNSGNIEIVASDTDQIIVDRTLQWSSDKPVSKETWSGDALSIKIEGCGNNFNFGSCGIDYRIQVPAEVSLNLVNDSGNVTVSGISGDIGIEVDSGDVELSDAAGAVDLDADSGNITADNLSSTEVTAKVDSGDIDLDFTTAPTSVDVSADSGSVEVALPDDGQPYDVDSTIDSGEEKVDVTTGPGAQRLIKAEVSSGDLTVRYN